MKQWHLCVSVKYMAFQEFKPMLCGKMFPPWLEMTIQVAMSSSSFMKWSQALDSKSFPPWLLLVSTSTEASGRCCFAVSNSQEIIPAWCNDVISSDAHDVDGLDNLKLLFNPLWFPSLSGRGCRWKCITIFFFILGTSTKLDNFYSILDLLNFTKI